MPGFWAKRASASLHSSVLTKGTLLPVIFSTRRSASSLELHRLSATMISQPASMSSTQVWLPIYPAPPLTKIDI